MNTADNKNNAQNSRKVWVGMSGGVDSSVSAYLLQMQGYDVTGVFIKVWQPDDVECSWKEERRDAMRVCAVLGIPFRTLDLSSEYKKQVVDYMIMEYAYGRTPNPDIMCNRHIKFGGFLKLARNERVDYVATGHYANVGKDATGRYVLSEGADKNKDQSYFLWTLNSDDLKNVLFPVGHLEKGEVRKIAEKAGLPVYDKKDSQGICFIGHVDMKDFLKKYIKTEKGRVLDESGNVIGQHDGSILYTIGERVGVEIFKSNKGSDDLPYYVLSKDVRENTLTVTHDNLLESGRLDNLRDKNTANNEIVLKNINLNTDRADLKNITARVRYRQSKHSSNATLVDNKGNKNESPTIKIKFEDHQVLAPGQSVVLYDGEVCLGGGIIG